MTAPVGKKISETVSVRYARLKKAELEVQEEWRMRLQAEDGQKQLSEASYEIVRSKNPEDR